jgi:hypothetical protein
MTHHQPPDDQPHTSLAPFDGTGHLVDGVPGMDEHQVASHLVAGNLAVAAVAPSRRPTWQMPGPGRSASAVGYDETPGPVSRSSKSPSLAPLMNASNSALV